MNTFVCFLWLIVIPTLYAASMSDQQLLKTTIGLLHKLGHRKPYMKCYREVGITSFDLSSSLPEKAQEMQPALKIAFNHTFEIFKKKSHGHWNSTALNDLMTFLHMQNKTYENSKVSSELETLETLVKNFKKLDQFLTEQNFSKCAWEIVRNEILGVMDTFRKKL